MNVYLFIKRLGKGRDNSLFLNINPRVDFLEKHRALKGGGQHNYNERGSLQEEEIRMDQILFAFFCGEGGQWKMYPKKFSTTKTAKKKKIVEGEP